MLKCNQSCVSGMDSGQHRSLHRTFRSLLIDRTNACANLDIKLKKKTLIFSIKRRDINLLNLFFSFLCCLSLSSYDRLFVEKNNTHRECVI